MANEIMWTRWAEVDDLFRQVLDLPEPDRLSHLEAACGPDRALFDAVRELLGALDRSEGMFESPRGRVLQRALAVMLYDSAHMIRPVKQQEGSEPSRDA